MSIEPGAVPVNAAEAARSQPKRSAQDKINVQRGELFKAQAVVNCVRPAITSQDSGLQETDITLALRVTAETIDGVAAALQRAGGVS